jgi:xanthine dehydrogenase YagR molybdenum-binding subunit
MLIKIQNEEKTPALKASQARETAKKPAKNHGEDVQLKKGDVEAALADQSLVILERIYETPTETHSPMEPSATVAEWVAEDRLTLHVATQFVKGVQDVLSQAFGWKKENVRVISPLSAARSGARARSGRTSFPRRWRRRRPARR